MENKYLNYCTPNQDYLNKKLLIVADLRSLEKQVSLGEISYSKMIEIINEKAEKYCEERLSDIIGDLEDGDHPDEIYPRAETWIKERKNWIVEVERLKEIVSGIPSEFQKYILRSLENIKHEGEIRSIHSYGASSFIKFKNGRCYRLNFQLYDDKVCLD
jgi:hypothetical protein